MIDVQTRTKAALLGVEPQLFVSDIARALDYYVRTLGFAQAFVWGDPPFYAQVLRDGARLNLRHLDAPAFDAARREHEQLLSASITTNDADALFQEYQAAGAVFAKTLETETWGARTFIVRDPDGNFILFAG